MLRKLAALLTIAAVGSLGLAATAADHERAVYTGLSPDCGMLQVTAQPATRVVVRFERQDATYGFWGSTVVGADGVVAISVPHRGPDANGQPQYVLQLVRPDGSGTTILAVAASQDGKPLDDLWWLD